MSCSRAVPTASITFSRSSYGLPGTTQIPSKPVRSSASVEWIQYGSSTSPSRRRSASMRSGMRPWARTVGERSPTRASLAADMSRIVASHRVHVQRSFVTLRSALLMDPRFLRTFVRVVRLGSFSAAARELGYTQSAVSQHIAVLEADVGVPLLTRRPVGVTEAGARLLEHAEPILLRLDAARADVARVASGPPSRLRIGTTPLACGFAAELVAPALAVTVRVGARDEIARAVAIGELDAGVVDGVAAPERPAATPGDGRARRPRRRGAAGRRRAPRSPTRGPCYTNGSIGRCTLDRRSWHLCPAPRTLLTHPRRRVPRGPRLRGIGRRRTARARRGRARPRPPARPGPPRGRRASRRCAGARSSHRVAPGQLRITRR